MPLSEIDRNLLERCLERKPRAWEDFVDRYIGLVVHVVDYSTNTRGMRMTSEGCDELCAEVFSSFLKDDFSLLRGFRGRCSLVAYLTVIARRIVEKKFAEEQAVAFRDLATYVRDSRGVQQASAVGSYPQLPPGAKCPRGRQPDSESGPPHRCPPDMSTRNGAKVAAK